MLPAQIFFLSLGGDLESVEAAVDLRRRISVLPALSVAVDRRSRDGLLEDQARRVVRRADRPGGKRVALLVRVAEGRSYHASRSAAEIRTRNSPFSKSISAGAISRPCTCTTSLPSGKSWIREGSSQIGNRQLFKQASRAACGRSAGSPRPSCRRRGFHRPVTCVTVIAASTCSRRGTGCRSAAGGIRADHRSRRGRAASCRTGVPAGLGVGVGVGVSAGDAR